MGDHDIAITIHGKASRRAAHSSDHSSSVSDEEDSSGTGVHISPSAGDTHDFSDQEEDSLGDDEPWTVTSKLDVNPSESASRLSSHDPRRSLAETRRRPSRREHEHRDFRRPAKLTRASRQPHYSPPDSEVGSHEDLIWDGPGYGPGYGPVQRQRPASYHQWAQQYPGVPGNPYAAQGYGPPSGYPPGQIPPHGQHLMRVQSGYGGPQLPYQQYQQPGSPPVPSSYYGQGHQGIHPGMHAPMPPHAGGGYGTPDSMQQYQVQPGMLPGMQAPGYFAQYPPPHSQYTVQPQVIQPQIQYIPIPTASPAPQSYSAAPSTPVEPATKSSPAPARAPSVEVPKNDGYEELKAMLLAEKSDREAREAAAKKAEEEKIAKAEADKKKQDEIAAAAKEAAEKAKSEAEKKAAEEAEAAAKKAADEATAIKTAAEEAMKKAAEEAAINASKAKEEAEEALKKAKEEADAQAAKAKEEAAAALAAASAVPPEKQKPIRFKDAVGRKFNFPFHLCNTWEGMDDLIKQAFTHVDVIGQHVAEGHYDLIGPGNEIILPAVWETVIEPDWSITMHMWPLPEPEPEPVVKEDPVVAVVDALTGVAVADTSNKDKKGKNKAGKTKAKAVTAAAAAAPPPPPPLPPPPMPQPAGVEIVGGPVPPPPPPGPPAPPGVMADASTGGAKKNKPKASSWSIFGPRPPPKPKAKAGAKKAG